MAEVITFSNPLEAWMWTHLEISIPILLFAMITIVILDRRRNRIFIKNHQKSLEDRRKWRK